MTITYELEPRDLRGFQRYGLKHLPNIRRVRYVLPVLIIGASLWIAISAKEQELGLPAGNHTGFRIFYFGALSLLLLAVWRGAEFFLTRCMEWRAYTTEKHKSLLCQHTVTLADDALVEVTSFNESRTAWQGIYRVVEVADYIYIFISLHSAHIIPKRAFSDVESARRFYDRAVRLQSAAREVAA
jgi:YcxB-like protein